MEPGEEFAVDYEAAQGGKPKNRRGGVVLHPTSFPGAYGTGDLGESAYDFIDWLGKAGMQAWQVLPLVPPERMFWSPYAGQNANSANVLLISLEKLVDLSLLSESELPEPIRDSNPGKADFDAAAALKEPLLSLAATRLVALENSNPLKQDFQFFCGKNEDWLDAAALFDCLSNSPALRGLSWWDWPQEMRDARDTAMVVSETANRKEIEEFKALQFLFDKQWMALRRHANSKGISIIGDMPIYVGGHSADVWANRKLFELSDDGKSVSVSGVPPDAFSKTGQLWGNPLYDWKAQKKDGYRWWIKRMNRAFDLYDETRIDHFRGFAGYWSVDAKEETAMVGKWRAGPGVDLFEALKKSLGEEKMNIMAEDLGVITPDVVKLREDIAAPGMLVLQFGFDGNPKNPHLPHNHYSNCFIYPGTHDNDTTQGWWLALDEKNKSNVKKYLNGDEGTEIEDLALRFIDLAMCSVAETAMFTMQDVLSLDNEARMNLPGEASGNWGWRFEGDFKSEDLDLVATKLRAIAEKYDRLKH
jgi:4-alpha-glucanotransferase